MYYNVLSALAIIYISLYFVDIKIYCTYPSGIIARIYFFEARDSSIYKSRRGMGTVSHKWMIKMSVNSQQLL